jgi:hypothetical protein
MQKQTHSYRFNLQLTPDEIARYYQGQALRVNVTTDRGQHLRFAACHLRPFITPRGIEGYFLLTTDENHRFKSLKKIDYRSKP